MADYYALLARAIEKQPGASPEARNYVYETARTALLAQLRATQPPPPEANIMAEQRALDEAIRQVEAGIEGDAPDSPAPPAVSPEAPKHETKRPGGWISDLLLRASRDTGRAIPPTASEESKSNSSQMDVGRRPTAAPSAAPDVSRPVAPKGTKAAAKPVVSAPLFATTARPQIQPPAHSTSGSRFAQEKPMSRLDELNRVLRKLQTDCPGVEASALISAEARRASGTATIFRRKVTFSPTYGRVIDDFGDSRTSCDLAKSAGIRQSRIPGSNSSDDFPDLH